jgi:hypothetical protein
LSSGAISSRARAASSDTHWKQGHASANQFSRDWRFLEKDKQRFGGYPDHQQESDRHDRQHFERPEMIFIRLAAHRAFFFNATQWYQPESEGGLHRKKKETYRGTISSLYRAGERWRVGLIRSPPRVAHGLQPRLPRTCRESAEL